MDMDWGPYRIRRLVSKGLIIINEYGYYTKRISVPFTFLLYSYYYTCYAAWLLAFVIGWCSNCLQHDLVCRHCVLFLCSSLVAPGAPAIWNLDIDHLRPPYDISTSSVIRRGFFRGVGKS
jgi:hypothetical protein